LFLALEAKLSPKNLRSSNNLLSCFGAVPAIARLMMDTFLTAGAVVVEEEASVELAECAVEVVHLPSLSAFIRMCEAPPTPSSSLTLIEGRLVDPADSHAAKGSVSDIC
jgi:hypothetical protein